MNRQEFFEKLRELEPGLGGKIIVTYSGYGDSGEFEEVIDQNGIRVNLSNSVENLIYNIFDERYAGIEINDGGQGKIIIDMIDETVKFEIYYNEVQEIADFKELT